MKEEGSKKKGVCHSSSCSILFSFFFCHLFVSVLEQVMTEREGMRGVMDGMNLEEGLCCCVGVRKEKGREKKESVMAFIYFVLFYFFFCH